MTDNRTIAYIEGRNSAATAYTGGNPYRVDTQGHADWQRGREEGQAALGLKPIDWAAERAAWAAHAAAHAAKPQRLILKRNADGGTYLTRAD